VDVGEDGAVERHPCRTLVKQRSREIPLVVPTVSPWPNVNAEANRVGFPVGKSGGCVHGVSHWVVDQSEYVSSAFESLAASGIVDAATARVSQSALAS
jgi:hypothetical protein